MNSAKAELLVGFFALVVLGLMLFMTFKVTDFSFKKDRGYKIYVFFRNTAGLDVQTRVKIAGVDAGVIEEIKLIEGVARVTLKMYPEIVLYSDATALIKATGLLGDKYIEVTPGENKPRLRDGDSIENVIGLAEVDDLVRNLTNISTSLIQLLANFTTDELRDSLTATTTNMRDITAELKNTLQTNSGNINNMIVSMSDILKQLQAAIEENRKSVASILQNVDTTSGEVSTRAPELLARMDETLALLNKLIEQTSPNIVALSQNASMTMANVNSIASKINDGEGTISKLINDPALYNSISGAASGIDKTVKGIDRLRTFITFEGEYLTEFKDPKSTLNIRFQPRDNKYYSISVVSDPVDMYDTTETTTGGVTTVTRTEKDNIEVTAHFARRFEDTVLRIGLTENTFGVGADHLLMQDRMELNLDAWDFGEKEGTASNPHITLGARFFATKHIFLGGGLDNMANSDMSGAYVGGGLRFEDEDFKYVLGSMPSIPGN